MVVRGVFSLSLVIQIVANPSDVEDFELSSDGHQSILDENDLWDQLTTDSWQPGRVGDHKTSLPMKDLECEGPQTQILSDSTITWALVKEGLQVHVAQYPSINPTLDPWLLKAAMQIQKHEPDTCALGLTATSAFLLPLTMPKFRNMARILSSDQDPMVLNVTFYDTLRSGFPVFGIMDRLATPEYREWFNSEESRKYFKERVPSEACEAPAAKALQADIENGRSSWQKTPLLSSSALLLDSSGTSGCPLATAAALIIYALVRAEGPLPTDSVRDDALRDIIELVSRAEELVRDEIGNAMLATGELVATPWNLWWLLQRLQVALPRIFDARFKGLASAADIESRKMKRKRYNVD